MWNLNKSLQEYSTKLALLWDVDKNGEIPNMPVENFYTYTLFWHCGNGHVVLMSIQEIEEKGLKCIMCSINNTL